MQTQTERKSLNMVERKEPTLISFAEGESVQGVLLAIERIEIEKKPVVRYTVRDVDTRELSSFLGTYQINAKIHPEDVGHIIDVRYEGEDRSVVRNGNALRRFKVLISDVPAARIGVCTAEDVTFITNDDVGF
jgi:hypothetical protein